MILRAVILGAVQGLAEFLPISSSGHLAILEKYLGIQEPVAFAAFLHFGTLIATVVFFFKTIISLVQGIFKGKRHELQYLVNIIVGSVPIVIFAVIFRSIIEASFTDIKLVALFLGISGVILLMTGIVRKKQGKIETLSAFIIGIGQMFAVFPGLSRSGLTISAGIFSGVKPEESFEFSFLLSLPAVLGANLLEIKGLARIDNPLSVLIGVSCSFVFGLIALKVLKGLVNRHFHIFGLYCLILSLAMLLLA